MKNLPSIFSVFYVAGFLATIISMAHIMGLAGIQYWIVILVIAFFTFNLWLLLAVVKDMSYVMQRYRRETEVLKQIQNELNTEGEGSGEPNNPGFEHTADSI